VFSKKRLPEALDVPGGRLGLGLERRGRGGGLAAKNVELLLSLGEAALELHRFRAQVRDEGRSLLHTEEGSYLRLIDLFITQL